MRDYPDMNALGENDTFMREGDLGSGSGLFSQL
jgi:hypothetical protein